MKSMGMGAGGGMPGESCADIADIDMSSLMRMMGGR
jgi:hypothetical protein